MNWAQDTFFEFVNQFWIEMHQKALADASKLASLIKTVQVFHYCSLQQPPWRSEVDGNPF